MDSSTFTDYSSNTHELESNLVPDKFILRKVAFEKVESTKLYITPPEIQDISSSADIDEIMKKKLEKTLLQTCTKDGFVISSSSSLNQMNRAKMADDITIVSRNAGVSPSEHLNGSWLYTIFYKYHVCNPPIGTIIPAIVCSTNKIGMMCNFWPYKNKMEDVDDPTKITIQSKQFIQGRAGFIVILLPKALHQQINVPDCNPNELYDKYEKQLDTLSPNKKLLVYVKILQKKFDINDKQISAVGILYSKDGSDSQQIEENDEEPSEKEDESHSNKSGVDSDKIVSEHDSSHEEDGDVDDFEDDMNISDDE